MHEKYVGFYYSVPSITLEDLQSLHRVIQYVEKQRSFLVGQMEPIIESKDLTQIQKNERLSPLFKRDEELEAILQNSWAVYSPKQ
jgi:hypothetical protein